jgi:hypothetical protein
MSNLLFHQGMLLHNWNGQAPAHYVGKASASALGHARWCTQHNEKGQGHSTTLRFDNFNKKNVQQTHFDHYYEHILIFIGRLCHIMWSRKWHNLAPNILSVVQTWATYVPMFWPYVLLNQSNYGNNLSNVQVGHWSNSFWG